ncbi:MAG: Sensor histidine kinase [Lachnoclostridium sp.]|jgi:hypothetical protein
MKLTDLAILFFAIELIVITILDVRTNNLVAVSNRTMEYNKQLDSAVEDGIANLVEVDSRRKLILNKDVAINQFYQSLFANFGVLGNSQAENKLKAYIPVILITDMDGFYIYYNHIYNSDGEKRISQKWTEKIPYAYEDGSLIYKFTLGTFVTLYNKTTNETYEGEYKDLAPQFPESILSDDEVYDSIRRNAIIDAIEKNMNYYINLHNRIAFWYGITYQFWLPQIDKTDWYRTIDDISMLVIFQGYPYTPNSKDTYNRYALGGARLTKSRVYNITEKKEIKYYHKADCPYGNPDGMTYYTKEECALEGAYPCPECSP